MHSIAPYNLQGALASGSAINALIASPGTGIIPHHPITCIDELGLDEDGAFHCPHATAPAGDRRTQACLNVTAAVLLLELAARL